MVRKSSPPYKLIEKVFPTEIQPTKRSSGFWVDPAYSLWFDADESSLGKGFSLVDFSQYLQVKPKESTALLRTGVKIRHIATGESVRLGSVFNLSPRVHSFLRDRPRSFYDLAYPDIASLPDVRMGRVRMPGAYQTEQRAGSRRSADTDRRSKARSRVAGPSLLGATLGLLGLLQHIAGTTLVHPLLLIPAILACASFTAAAVLQRRAQSSGDGSK